MLWMRYNQYSLHKQPLRGRPIGLRVQARGSFLHFMMFWLAILGVYMGWVEAVYGEPEKPLTATDSLPEIPPMFKAGPAVQEAEKLVRSRR